MRMRFSTLILGALLLTGCYHVTVISGTSPSPTVVDKPWQNSFVYGLVPPPELNVKEQCPNGVQKVETETSFLNGLVGALTWSLFTPIHAKVTCSAR
jgi:Bor protein